MRELLEILIGFLAVAALVWFYLHLCLFLDDLGERLFGPSFRWWRRRAPKMEIQTLFSGKTKDQDQI
jgi:hypothetical protein